MVKTLFVLLFPCFRLRLQLLAKFHTVNHAIINLLSTLLDDFNVLINFMILCVSIKVMNQRKRTRVQKMPLASAHNLKEVQQWPAAVHYSKALWHLWVKVCVCVCVRVCQRQDNGVQQRWGMHSLLLGFYIFYIVSLRQANISVTDGQHVILMLSLWQQLKVKLRHSWKRQRRRVIKQEALFSKSNLTSWEKKLIPKSNVKCINSAWMFLHPSW